MSVNPQETQNQEQQQNVQRNDKEYNFAQIRQQLEREKQEKLQLKEEVEKLKQLAQERFAVKEEEDVDDEEPYIDHKRLKKELTKVVKQTKTETQSDIQAAVSRALAEERQRQWLKQNPDFHEVMEHAQTFADKDPELAESILEMPEGFERQKLVYKNIKALGLHKPQEQKKSDIQDKIEQNRRSPYYQPSGIGTAPYGMATVGKDWSPAEGQNAYKKMQELKSKLRI